jgi:hypothetical protein
MHRSFRETHRLHLWPEDNGTQLLMWYHNLEGKDTMSQFVKNYLHLLTINGYSLLFHISVFVLFALFGHFRRLVCL